MEDGRNTGDMRRLATELLAAPLRGEEELSREMEARGVMPNGAGALLYAQWKRALGGDLKAACFLRELAEQDAAEAAGPSALREMSDRELYALLAAGGDGRAKG